MSEYKIYSLSDPSNIDNIKYIGVTKRKLTVRLKGHIDSVLELNDLSLKNKKDIWIKSLLNKNKMPIISLIDIIDENNWEFWEMYYISLFKTWGFDLLNTHIGGKVTNSCGANNHMFHIAKEKHPMFGKTHTEEAKRIIGIDSSSRNKGEGNPMFGKRGELCPHYGKKKGPHSEETKQKIRDTKLKKRLSLES